MKQLMERLKEQEYHCVGWESGVDSQISVYLHGDFIAELWRGSQRKQGFSIRSCHGKHLRVIIELLNYGG